MKNKKNVQTILIIGIIILIIAAAGKNNNLLGRQATLNTCGDNYCTTGESTSCPQDCAHSNTCGDGVCSGCPSLTSCGSHPDVGENHDNCPIDCYLEGDASTSTSRKLYETYETYDQVVAQLKALEPQYPGLVSHEIIGKSYQGKDIYLFKVGNPNGGTFMFDGRVHGMEDCGTENGIAFIKWVLTNNSIDSNNVKNGNYLLFIPGINIDSTRRQNMNREDSILWGVDLNRNSITGWSSSSPSSVSTYSGPSAGSEPETKAYMAAMTKYKPKIYMNVHCGMRMLSGTGPLYNTIVTNIQANANKYGRTNTMSWYSPGSSCLGSGFVCSAGKSITGAEGNGWIHETTYHGSLPVSLNDYLNNIYSQAFPIYLGMAQAVQNTSAPINQPNPEPIVTVTHPLVNGGFENGTTGWAVRHGNTLDCTVARTGSCSMRSSATIFDPTQETGTGDSRAMWISTRIPVKEGQKIFVSWYAKTNGTNPVCLPGQTRSCNNDAGIRVGVDFKHTGNSSPIRANNGQMVNFGTPTWTYRSFNDTIRAHEEGITLWLQGKPFNYSDGTGWFDDIVVEIIDPNNQTVIINQTNNTVCTADAKQCSDGSFVGRNLSNNCEWNACPINNNPNPNPNPEPFDIAAWIKEQWESSTGKVIMIGIVVLLIFLFTGRNRTTMRGNRR